MKPRFAILLLLALAAGGSEAAALEPGAMRSAAAYSASCKGAALLVFENGTRIHEQYSNGGSASEPHRIYSGTKAFWNLAALAAAEDGLLDFDEPAGKTIAEWRGDPRKARITVRQLLDFSSGLEPGFFLHGEEAADRDRLAMNLRCVAEPGRAFIYGPASLQVFHQILKRKLSALHESPTSYLERRVLAPLGLGAQRYLADRAGSPLLATGWQMKARQWAKLGQLVLAGGAPVLAQGSLAQSWRGSPANRAFALGWWNNRAAPEGREFDIEEMLERDWPRQRWSGACVCRDAPADLVACIGSGCQRLYVIPSMSLVIVRQGAGGKFSDAKFLRLLLGR